MKKRTAKMLCFVLSVMMLSGSMPLSVLAENAAQVATPGQENPASLVTQDITTEAESVAGEAGPTQSSGVDNPGLNNAGSLPGSETMEVQEENYDGYRYEPINGQATITGYNGTATTLEIPSSLDGNTVVMIRAGAFNACTTLTRVTIPITVTTIYSETTKQTFGGCTSLTEVVIPASVKKIGPSAFDNKPGFSISGNSNSFAQKYALEYGIKFVPQAVSVALAPSLPSGQNIGTELTLTATISGGSGSLSAHFFYDRVDAEGNRTTDTIPNATATTAKLPLTKAGSYNFYVEVKNGTSIVCANAIDSYKVVNQPSVELTSGLLAPQYKDIPLPFTATVTGGTAPYTYQFSYQQGANSVVDQTFPDVNSTTQEWKKAAITVPGIYTFTVKVTDKYGLEATKSITNFQIYEKLDIDGFTVDKASPQELGTALKLTAVATGGITASEYRFYYQNRANKNDSLGSEVEIQPYSNMASTTFTPPTAGYYDFYVDATNAYGVVITKKLLNYEIRDTPVIGKFTAAKADNSPCYLDDPAASRPIVLKTEAVSEGTAPYNYSYYYETKTIVKKQFASAEDLTETSFDPVGEDSGAGSYTFYVEVTDAKGKKVERQVSNYIVYPAVGGTLTTTPASSQNKNTKITLNATGSGGKAPYKYQFFYKLKGEDDSKYLPLNTISTTKTLSKVMDKAGDYILMVEITDANGHKGRKTSDFTINDNSLITQFVSDQDAKPGHYSGEAITFTAKVDPVPAADADMTLEFSVKNGSKVMEIPVADKPIIMDNVFTYTPKSAGSYTFTVTLKNKDGSIADSKKIATYKVMAAVSAKPVKASKPTVVLGSVVKLTATGAGGKTPYQYEFYVKGPGSDKPVKIRDAKPEKTFDYTALAVGTYTFYTRVIDTNLQDNEETYVRESASTAVTVINPPVVELVPSPAKGLPIYAGENITLTANLKANTGVGTLKYQFYYLQGKTKVFLNETPETEDTVTFEAPPAGSYTLGVEVTDDLTTVPVKISSYKILPAVTVKSLKADKMTDVNINTPVKLTATAAGGKGPYRYEFYAINDSDVVIPIQAYSLNKTATFTPTTDGGYTLHVNIKDVNNRLCENSEVYIDTFNAVDYPILKPIVTDNSAGIATGTAPGKAAYVEDEITVSAAVSGGKSPYTYEYFYQKGTATAEPLDPDPANSAKAVFIPNDPGSYKLIAKVTDKEGNKDDETLKTFVVWAKPQITALTVSKATMIKGSGKVNLTAKVTGGQKPYSYEFYVAKGTAEPVLIARPYATTYSYGYTPGETGDYTFSVKVKDKNGVAVGADGDKTLTVTTE